MDRNETIKRIKAALKRRSGKTWSVTGGRGTAWGWITIDSPPARKTWNWVLPDGADDVPHNYVEIDSGIPGSGHAGPDERRELAALLGLDNVHIQGQDVPASSAYYQEYIDRAAGRKPSKLGEPYWD